MLSGYARPHEPSRARKSEPGNRKEEDPELHEPLQISRLSYVLSPPFAGLVYKSTPPPSTKEGRKKRTHFARDTQTRFNLIPRFSSCYVHGASRPAVGRHGGRAAAGLRPRQAPQVRLLLPVVHHLRGVRCRGRRPVGRRAGGDAEHHHPPPAGSLRAVVPKRVRLRAVVAGQRPRLPLGHSNDAQGRGLEQVPPERQDGRRRHGRRQPRHAQKPHRLRLGGDQFARPLTEAAPPRREPHARNESSSSKIDLETQNLVLFTALSQYIRMYMVSYILHFRCEPLYAKMALVL